MKRGRNDDTCDYTQASEQEWRRILFDKITKVEDKLHNMSQWILVYRILGGGAFALLVAWVGSR